MNNRKNSEIAVANENEEEREKHWIVYRYHLVAGSIPAIATAISDGPLYISYIYILCFIVYVNLYYPMDIKHAIRL